MALATWSDSYKVGVAEFDEQHRRWFGLLNELHEAMAQGKGKTVVGKTLDAVVVYTRTHFAAEEAKLKQTGYPDYEKHKALHDAYITEIRGLQQSFMTGSKTVTVQMLNSMHDWLVNHIQVKDKLYGAHLNAKGVK